MNRKMIAAAVLMAGAVSGGAVALLLPVRYVSSAVLAVARPGESTATTRRWIAHAQQSVLSRSSLAELIQRPSLDLYRADRARLPMEDIIQTMSRRDIRIEMVAGNEPTFRISFTYPDAWKAPAVVSALVERFMAAEAGRSVRRLEMPAGPGVAMTSRAWTLAAGVLAGVLLGALILAFRRQGLKSFAIIAGSGLAAGLLAEVGAYFGEILYPADLELGILGFCAGAAAAVFVLRRNTGPLRKPDAAIAAAAAGAILAGLFSFALPNTYLSTALLRISPPDSTAEISDRMQQIEQYILSRGNLAELIQRPALDLYQRQRSRRPMEDVVNAMRADLQIAPAIPGEIDSVAIAFRYPDRYKAQAVAREVVSYFMEQNNRLERMAGHERGSTPFLALEVLDPPNLPELPIAPNRLVIIGLGAILGLVVLVSAFAIGRRPPPIRGRMLRFGLGGAAAGALIAAVISLALPSRYISSAVLRIVAPPSGAADNDAAEDLQMRIGNIFGEKVLADVIERPSLDLYASERKRLPIKDVMERMRTRDLRIETLKVSDTTGLTQALRISFEYPDREKAHALVQALVTLLVEGSSAHPGTVDFSTAWARQFAPQKAELKPEPARANVPSKPAELLAGIAASNDRLPAVNRTFVEVLDPPSVPEAAVAPRREEMIGVGLIAGLLMGTVVAVSLRRSAT